MDASKFTDGPTVEGRLEDFFQPGFAAPTFGDDGKISGTVVVTKVDEKTNTIWLTSTPRK